MENYLYVSMYPESLIASMLPPKEFGRYLAVGTKKRVSKQEAVFFEVDPDKCTKVFDIADMNELCQPHDNGEPKHSIYYSIYRVLERMPMEAIKNLYLVTKAGQVLELQRDSKHPEFSDQAYLYQEISPVHPRIASSLNPVDFVKFITDPKNKLYVPKIFFVDLRLGELAQNPENGSIQNLPYQQIDYLRECIKEVKSKPGKHTKTVNRTQDQSFMYRVINHGFYLGSGSDILYFSFPSEHELNTTFYDWWKSATH